MAATDASSMDQDLYCYKWTIDNFKDLTEETGESITSMAFPFCESAYRKWCIVVYPRGIRSAYKDYISVYLKLVESKDNFETTFNFSLLNSSNIQLFFPDKTITPNVFEPGKKWGQRKFIDRETLFKANGLLSNGALTIVCEIDLKEEVPDLIDIEVTGGKKSAIPVAYTHHITNTYCYTWNIRKFKKLMEKTGECVTSPKFPALVHAEHHWCIVVFPRGIREGCEDYVSVYVKILEENEKLEANFNFFLYNEDDQKMYSSGQNAASNPVRKSFWGKRKFIKRDRLFQEGNSLLPGGDLIIRCEVNVMERFATVTRDSPTEENVAGNGGKQLTRSRLSLHRLSRAF